MPPDRTDLDAQLDRPCLLTVIHTEEAFDWERPFSSDNKDVGHISCLTRAQRVFEELGVAATYMVDYPVARDPHATEVIARLMGGVAPVEIGSHLHPWVTPPSGEPVDERHSFPGNLPEQQERDKLHTLTETIVDRLSVRPRAYLAGRYGVGTNTYDILKDLGYRMDLSPSPLFDYSSSAGPNFTKAPRRPSLQDGILVVPHTTGFVGAGARTAPLTAFIPRGAAREFWERTVLNRLGIGRLARLSPEGFSLSVMRKLTSELYDGGQRVFLLSFHSSSLEVGNTPYVRTPQDLDRFLRSLRNYLGYFADVLKGRFVLPGDLLRTMTPGLS